ncbi:hypothetical protein BH11ACT8_BH11ACT8_31460 [soil metagenome]
MHRALSCLVLLLVVTASGCSGDAEPAADPSPSVVLLLRDSDGVRGLARAYAGDHPDAQDLAEGKCFAERLQADESLDLRAAGIVDATNAVVDPLPVFDEATAEAWIDAELACVDYADASARAILVQSKGAVDAESFTACLRAGLSDEQVRAALVDTLTGDFASDAVSLLSSTQADCAAG